MDAVKQAPGLINTTAENRRFRYELALTVTPVAVVRDHDRLHCLKNAPNLKPYSSKL